MLGVSTVRGATTGQKSTLVDACFSFRATQVRRNVVPLLYQQFTNKNKHAPRPSAAYPLTYPCLLDYKRTMEVTTIDARNGRKARFVTVESLDGRTRSARRVHAIMRSLQRQLRKKPSATESMLIQRVAVLATIAEDARVRLLQGDPAISHDAVVRADNCYRRAAADFLAIAKREPTPVYDFEVAG
jgi:hypothetical protein